MSEIHILNVGPGDCTIIEHESKRVTMVDICGGNLKKEGGKTHKQLIEFYAAKAAAKGNFRMCEKPTNPIEFLKEKMHKSSIWRFVLSHPDMDHLDGFEELVDNVNIAVYWDNGTRKEKPKFTNSSRYKEEDWDRYERVRDNKEPNINVISPLAGDSDKYWGKNDDGTPGGDFIRIYAPDATLVKNANTNGDANDASYVIVYRSYGGRIFLPGDAHNETMEYVLKHYGSYLKECEFMVAPHHGRDSDRDWTFLDKIKPKFTVFGCAPSRDLAYDAWNRRGLKKITQNQAGNIAVYPGQTDSGDRYLAVYVENEKFAQKYPSPDPTIKDNYGNTYLTSIIMSPFC